MRMLGGKYWGMSKFGAGIKKFWVKRNKSVFVHKRIKIAKIEF